MVLTSMAVARRIGAAQTTPVSGNVDANIEQHVRLIRAAASESVQVLVFPELSLTGYELDLADELGFCGREPRLRPLVDAASSAAVILVVGAPVRIDARLYIGAFIIAPNESIDVYTKQHLGAFSKDVNPDGPVPPPEHAIFQPGRLNPLVQLEGHTAAIAVCAESLYETHPKEAADRGASTYLTSHFGIPLDVGFRAAVLRGHAARHSMAVAFANYGGPTGGLPAGGKSAIWSESGDRLAELDPTGPGVMIARERSAGWHTATLAPSGS